jgi:predicted molibdopterin-dependent oxidoreductase YjgC
MNVSIDGTEIDVQPGTTVLEAIHALGKDVPTLCYDDRQAPFGACRVCLVGAVGAAGPIPACTTPCRDGMVIDTVDPLARRVVTAVVELVLSELPERPAPHTELAIVATGLGLFEPPAGEAGALELRWPGAVHAVAHDNRHPYLAFQHELCISCGRCVRACDEVQGAFALTATGRGFSANVTAGLDAGFRDSTCVSCGACADTCPTDAITEIRLLEIAQAV